MFNLSRETELTPDLLYKMISKFNNDVKPKLQTYKDYYDGIQNIRFKNYNDKDKPCNKAVTNYCKNITDSYCGYLCAPGFVSYSSEDDIEEILNVLKYNDYQEEDAAFLLDALVYGVAAELMYTDEQGQVRFRLINPTTCFGIFDDCLTQELIYFVRMYKVNDWDDSNIYNVDVYSDYDIKHYQMHVEMGGLEFIGEEKHFFNQCPANIFYLPDEKSIFDCIKPLQDIFNETLNAQIDDYAAFVDAFLVIQGANIKQEKVAAMRTSRILTLPEGATAQWLVKNADSTGTENLLKRIHDSIYRIASCPDFSSETFVGGVSSGIALKFRLCGMENRAAKIEALMKKALLKRVELICGIASLKIGEEVFSNVDITFKRNIPDDSSTLVNTVNALRGVVSDETLLGMIPQVSDVQAELERVQKQKKENMELYSFGAEENNNDET